MRRFQNLAELDQIKDDPELRRVMSEFMEFCTAEILEYADATDLAEHDFNFVYLTETEQEYLTGLGMPEEMVPIPLQSREHQRIVQRWVYPTEVVFLEAGGGVLLDQS